jgi:dTDP-4-amino-4,6-dideoxygalactose transaminase
MIPMNAFQREPESLRAEELKAAQGVLESGWFILGERVRAFESQWASRIGARHAIGVGNGMDAIEIGLRCLDIGAGDEVITTPMTAFATVLAILRAGATPVLADIDPDTALLDRRSVERCISAKTRAVLLVHLYGQVGDMDDWVKMASQGGFHLLEDCAQSHLAMHDDACSGSIGTWGAFSFYPTKNLGAVGDGGVLSTNDENVAARARMLRNYGQSERYHHPVLGLNSRLDEMQAALLTVRLRKLDEFTSRRREIAGAYRSRLQNPKIHLLADARSKQSHVYHLFVICCDERDRLANHLKAGGVETLIHYPVPVHHQPPCRDVKCDPLGLVEAERHAAVCLSIPCHPFLSDAEVSTIIEAVNDFR